MDACIISFGPVESRTNGYFLRVWNITNGASKFFDRVFVLEFPEKKVQPISRMKNITFVRLLGNHVPRISLDVLLRKIITFDPIRGLRFQLLASIQLLLCRKYISSADIVIVEGCAFPVANLLANLLGKKVILDTHGINRLLARQYRPRRKLVYFFRALSWGFLERLTMKLSDIVVVVCEKEREFAVSKYHIAESNVLIVPNAVEMRQLSVDHIATRELRRKHALEGKIVVCFVGDMDMVQNADAVDYLLNELAPRIWENRKDIVFLIIGRKGQRLYRSLPNVIFAGFVKDLGSYISASDVCIAPLRVGCGIKTKMLEYLVRGKPIVTTEIGVEGLESIISNYTQNSVKVVPLCKFCEGLLDTISDLHKINPVAVPNRLFLEDFEEKINKVLLNVSKI